MTTRADFVQKATARGLSRELIKAAMEARRTQIGAFDDDAPAPAAEEPPIANPGNTRPEVSVSPVSRIALPAFQQYREQHGDAPSVGRYGALAKDVISSPRRIFGAGVELAQGNVPAARAEMEKTQGSGILENITREAPLMLMPAARLAGAGVGRIGSAFAAGAREAIPSAGYHQAERRANDQEFSLPAAAGEMAAGGALRGAFEGVRQLAGKAVGPIKRGIARITEVSKDALDEVTDPVSGQASLEKFKAAGKKFGTENGVDVMPIAEELGQRVEGENAARIGAVDASRAQQLSDFEKSLLKTREDVVGQKASRIKDISAGDRGEGIKFSLEEAKPGLQKTYREGDVNAYQGLRDAPALTQKVKRIVTEQQEEMVPWQGPDGQGYERPMTVPVTREIVEDVPVLPGRIDNVLAEFKALKPEQGVPKITEGAIRAIKWAAGLAGRAKTVDDLVDLKAQVRGLQASGGFEGALFDATRDDLALAKVMEQIHQVEAESIRKAAPKQAAKVLPLVEANNALYGRTLEFLRKGDLKFRTTQNSENIISKIKAMGPEEARALMSEAKTNKVLKPYVKELRNGFVDDLLMSSVKDGNLNPGQMAKEWANVSDDVKQAWLTPQIIAKIDDAVKKGAEEIADPDLVGKALFGKSLDVFAADHKLQNIKTEAQKKALAELQSLDALFGTEFTQEAIAAYRAKQLQIGPSGNLAPVGNIRTGKSMAMAGSGGAAGAGMGAAAAGPFGAAVGSAIGSGLGFFLQSPAGAVLMFKALNGLNLPPIIAAAGAAAKETIKRSAVQGLRNYSGEKVGRISR